MTKSEARTTNCHWSFFIGHWSLVIFFLCALSGREKKCIAGFQPAKVVLTQKELSRLRCRRDAGATIFSHDPCVRGEAFRWLSGFRHSSLEIDAQVELDLPHRAASRHPAEIERIHYCPHSRKIRMVEHVGNQPAELDAAVVVIQAEAL